MFLLFSYGFPIELPENMTDLSRKCSKLLHTWHAKERHGTTLARKIWAEVNIDCCTPQNMDVYVYVCNVCLKHIYIYI